jgi:hypothetical protein
MKIASLVVLCGLFSLPLKAAPPSSESVEKLMAISKVQDSLDAVLSGSEEQMKMIMTQAMKAYPENPKLQKVAAEIGQRFGQQFVEALRWKNLKDAYLKLYQETFTQEEVDAQIAFYATPVGQSIVAKGPALGAKSGQIMQQQYMPLLQKLQATIREEFGKALREE